MRGVKAKNKSNRKLRIGRKIGGSKTRSKSRFGKKNSKKARRSKNNKLKLKQMKGGQGRQKVTGGETLLVARINNKTIGDDTYGIYPFLHPCLLEKDKQTELIKNLETEVNNFFKEAIREDKIGGPQETNIEKIPLAGFEGTEESLVATILGANPPQQCSIYNYHPHIAINLNKDSVIKLKEGNKSPGYGYGKLYENPETEVPETEDPETEDPETEVTETEDPETEVTRHEAQFTPEGGTKIKEVQTTYDKMQLSDLLKFWFSADYLKNGSGLRACKQQVTPAARPGARKIALTGEEMKKYNYEISVDPDDPDDTDKNQTFLGGFYWKIEKGENGNNDKLICSNSTLGPLPGDDANELKLNNDKNKINRPNFNHVTGSAVPIIQEELLKDLDFLPNGFRPCLISKDIIIEEEEGVPKYLLKIFSNFVHGKPWINPVTNQFQGWFFQLKKNGKEHEQYDEL